MGSAATAKQRLSRLGWSDWAGRVDQLLSVAGLSMADLPQYAYRSYWMAGVPSGTVAVKILRAHGLDVAGEGEKVKLTKVK